MAGPQRHLQRLGRLGADPRLGFELDANAYYDGTQVQIGHLVRAPTSGIGSLDVVGARVRPRRGRQDAWAASRAAGTEEFVGDTFGAGLGGLRQLPGARLPTSGLVRRSTWWVRARSGTCTTRLAVGYPNCYSSWVPNAEVHVVAGTWETTRSTCCPRAPTPLGGPASTTCNSGSIITGVGIEKAQQIMYNAMLLKTTFVVAPGGLHLER